MILHFDDTSAYPTEPIYEDSKGSRALMYEYVDTFAAWQGWVQKNGDDECVEFYSGESTYIQEHC